MLGSEKHLRLILLDDAELDTSLRKDFVISIFIVKQKQKCKTLTLNYFQDCFYSI